MLDILQRRPQTVRMTQSKVPTTGTFQDFVSWAGTQRAAASFVGLSESMVSLILRGDRPLLPLYAIRAEQASNGVFRAEQLLPGREFHRDALGRALGHFEPANECSADEPQKPSVIANKKHHQ